VRILAQHPAASLALLLAAAATIPQAHAANLPGWYVGVNGGQSDIRSQSGGLDDAFASQGLATSSFIDRHSTAWSIDAGMQLNRWLGVEASYVDFGRFDFNSVVVSPAFDALDGRYKARGAGVNLVGTLPLSQGFSLFGKAGVLRSKAELEPNSTALTPVSSESQSRTSGTWGLGASYAFTKNWAAQVEWDRYLKIGDSSTTGRTDIDLVTAGVRFTF
jgi:OOP family OmpA-OmpF porin